MSQLLFLVNRGGKSSPLHVSRGSMPADAEYQARTERQIAVFVVEP
jgi:hypothetical protein